MFIPMFARLAKFRSFCDFLQLFGVILNIMSNVSSYHKMHKNFGVVMPKWCLVVFIMHVLSNTHILFLPVLVKDESGYIVRSGTYGTFLIVKKIIVGSLKLSVVYNNLLIHTPLKSKCVGSWHITRQLKKLLKNLQT